MDGKAQKGFCPPDNRDKRFASSFVASGPCTMSARNSLAQSMVVRCKTFHCNLRVKNMFKMEKRTANGLISLIFGHCRCITGTSPGSQCFWILHFHETSNSGNIRRLLNIVLTNDTANNVSGIQQNRFFTPTEFSV